MGLKKVIKNASWIIGCKIVQAMLTLVVTMLTARYLGPSNYGVVNYAASVVAFAVPIMQLGLRNVLVQEFVNDPQKEGEILGTSLCMTLISAVCCMVGVFAFASIVNHDEPVTIVVCVLYSINLIFQALEMVIYWFQAKLLSKYQSVTSLIAYAVVSVYKIYLLVTEKNIYWFAISQALDYAIISIVLLVCYKKLNGGRLSFSLPRSKALFQKGRYYIVANIMVTLFGQTDKVMLKLMVDDAATGLYSAALTCATMTSFIFAAIIDSARPMIFESKKHGQDKFQQSVTCLYSIAIYFALAQSLVMTLGADLFIKILYGSEYAVSANVLRVVVWFTTFSNLGSVRNIWMLAEDRHQYLWIINSMGAITNVVLNLLLIPTTGMIGAAVASLVTQFVTNVVIGFILKPIRENNRLMCRGLHPGNLLALIRQVRRDR